MVLLKLNIWSSVDGGDHKHDIFCLHKPYKILFQQVHMKLKESGFKHYHPSTSMTIIIIMGFSIYYRWEIFTASACKA